MRGMKCAVDEVYEQNQNLLLFLTSKRQKPHPCASKGDMNGEKIIIVEMQGTIGALVANTLTSVHKTKIVGGRFSTSWFVTKKEN